MSETSIINKIEETHMREMKFIEEQRFFLTLLENFYHKKRAFELLNLQKNARGEEKEAAKFNAYNAKSKVLDILRDKTERKFFAF